MNRFCPHSFISTPHPCLPRAGNPPLQEGREEVRETGKGIVLYNEHIELKRIIAYKSILIKINGFVKCPQSSHCERLPALPTGRQAVGRERSNLVFRKRLIS
ncbi:MAG: hypothetical protein A2026_13215 [Deltaproteobacteria bacterium RBG_19FT_COMBO_46_12]|nr:MAG: hypothetical protein A2026_13215 [Deltaproteobacteria bacterium RBG_19FT_COMBO_46_12]